MIPWPPKGLAVITGPTGFRIPNLPAAELVLFPENGRCPRVIRRYMEELRDRTQKGGANILLATYSPVVLNEFNRDYEAVWVVKGGLIFPLLTLKKADYLKHFSLGDLYMGGELDG